MESEDFHGWVAKFCACLLGVKDFGLDLFGDLLVLLSDKVSCMSVSYKLTG